MIIAVRGVRSGEIAREEFVSPAVRTNRAYAVNGNWYVCLIVNGNIGTYMYVNDNSCRYCCASHNTCFV